MAHSLSFLLSADAAEQRNARVLSSDAAYGWTIGAVVHVEFADGAFEEVDAPSAGEARAIALNWLRHFGGVSAAIRTVGTGGALSQPEAILDFRDVA